jgi:hypothetical protein
MCAVSRVLNQWTKNSDSSIDYRLALLPGRLGHLGHRAVQLTHCAVMLSGVTLTMSEGWLTRQAIRSQPELESTWPLSYMTNLGR